MRIKPIKWQPQGYLCGYGHIAYSDPWTFRVKPTDKGWYWSIQMRTMKEAEGFCESEDIALALCAEAWFEIMTRYVDE